MQQLHTSLVSSRYVILMLLFVGTTALHVVSSIKMWFLTPSLSTIRSTIPDHSWDRRRQLVHSFLCCRASPLDTMYQSQIACSTRRWIQAHHVLKSSGPPCGSMILMFVSPRFWTRSLRTSTRVISFIFLWRGRRFELSMDSQWKNRIACDGHTYTFEASSETAFSPGRFVPCFSRCRGGWRRCRTLHLTS